MNYQNHVRIIEIIAYLWSFGLFVVPMSHRRITRGYAGMGAQINTLPICSSMQLKFWTRCIYQSLTHNGMPVLNIGTTEINITFCSIELDKLQTRTCTKRNSGFERKQEINHTGKRMLIQIPSLLIWMLLPLLVDCS